MLSIGLRIQDEKYLLAVLAVLAVLASAATVLAVLTVATMSAATVLATTMSATDRAGLLVTPLLVNRTTATTATSFHFVLNSVH
jgi:hypothetical protein